MGRGLTRRATVVASLLACVATGSFQRARAAPLDQVRQNGALRLCADPAALPYSDRSSPNGLPGFQVEFAEALAREMGLGLAVVWDEGRSASRHAECDASLDAIALAAGYEVEGQTGPLKPASLPLRFTKPYAGSGAFLVVASGSQARRFADLDGQKIGVTVASVAHEWLAERKFKLSVFPVQDEIVAAVAAGEIGAGAVTAPIVGWYRHEHPDAKVMIPAGYEPEPPLRWNVAIALRRADDALVNAVNTAIDRVTEQRLPYRIYAKYGVAYHPPYPEPDEGAR